MKFASALAFTAAAAAAYVASRQLLDRESLVARLPGPVRAPVAAVRARLVLARERAVTVLSEAERERRAAEAELLSDYYRRVGRSSTGGALPSPAPTLENLLRARQSGRRER